jgi:hypothetical protein
LLIDDRWVEATNLVRVTTPPEKHAAPVITGREDQNATPYVTVRLENGRFRAWYGAGWDGGPLSQPAYMESADGINWERPRRLLTIGAPLLFIGNVFPTPAGLALSWFGIDPAHPDVEHPSSGMWLGSSETGLAFSPLGARPILPGVRDIITVVPDRDRYLALFKLMPNGRRIVGMSESTDLEHWSQPRVVITPDANEDARTEFYGVGGVVRRGKILVGLLRVLRDDIADGIGWTELTWSNDNGRTWQRDQRQFLAPSQEPGAWDHAMAWGADQEDVGNRTYVYYGGYDAGHKTNRYTGRQIGVAFMLRDRYVARAGTGYLRTKPLGRIRSVSVNAAGPITLVATDRGGAVRCKVGGGDGIARRARCTRAFRGSVRLTFRLNSARLWAFSVR